MEKALVKTTDNSELESLLIKVNLLLNATLNVTGIYDSWWDTNKYKIIKNANETIWKFGILRLLMVRKEMVTLKIKILDTENIIYIFIIQKRKWKCQLRIPDWFRLHKEIHINARWRFQY